MHYNHVKRIRAPPSAIFPWLLQLGKGRGGWYLPRSFERVLPKSMHASRSLNPAWTALSVGDRVEDYGFDEKEDFFIAAEILPNEALVYKSERYGTIFTWALIVEQKEEEWSEVRLRFRGKIQRTGWQRKLLVWGGGWMDWFSAAPMIAGLKERVERAKPQ